EIHRGTPSSGALIAGGWGTADGRDQGAKFIEPASVPRLGATWKDSWQRLAGRRRATSALSPGDSSRSGQRRPLPAPALSPCTRPAHSGSADGNDTPAVYSPGRRLRP